MIKSTFLILFLYSSLSILGQSQALTTLLDKQELQNTSIGISIVSIESGKEITGYNPRRNLIPASILKVATAGYVLKKLNEDHKIKTPIFYSGQITDGTLHGDVYIQASSDPSWASRHDYNDQETWTTQFISILNKNNINCIQGNVIWIISESNYGPSDTWAWQDIGNYYGVGHYPIHHRDNSYAIHWDVDHTTGTPARIIKTVPSQYESLITNQVLIGDKGSGDQSYIYGGPYAQNLIIKGSIGRQQAVRITKGALTDPIHSAYLELYDSLQVKNISISYGYETIKNPPKTLNLLGELYSPRLGLLTQEMLFHSDNTMAENLVHHATETDDWKSLTKDIKTSFSITDQIIIRDGSGLSHFNAVSPQSMNQILRAPLKDDRHYWDDQLIKSGEGSLRSLFNSLPNGFTIYAKSGSMSGVRCYTGIIYRKDNPVYAFTLMANHFTCPGYKVARFFDDYLRAFLTIKE